MFYYLSFLRPPPAQAGLAQTEHILITPQITNDLRTEYLEDVVDIYYSWSLVPDSRHQTTPVITRPAKLTSWRTTHAYKEISVPRPQSLRDGQSWQLILSVGATRKDQVIPLCSDDIGDSPFAVMSMPILFTNRPRKAVKQEEIVRSYLLRAPTQDASPPVVFNICEQTSFDLDKKVWDSGIGLSSWLVQLYFGAQVDASPALSRVQQALLSRNRRNIIELGAGTGIVAITLGILRSKLDTHGELGRIVTTDLPSALPLLQHNISSNNSLLSKVSPEPAALDWEVERLPDTVMSKLDTGLDAIVMADVTYNTASFPVLISTLSRLVKFSQSKRADHHPTILLGYKERDVAERTLWDMVRDVGIDLEQVAVVNGADGAAIEIWVGSAT
ncbi:putative methyltransferase-domain-containing protein [Pisolithus croceorrhizus]|nr:putative methyltransferase-domain-containing protein [Pisolithus croceorrhizus]KAI6167437.1 putative methyltransferase-domain-containing protein [Pisolithus thermaeus]